MLVIGCPGNPGSYNFLPNVEEEVCEIIDSWPPEFYDSSTIMIGEEANHDNVLSQLPQHPWVHFACHGEQNPKPFDSSFLLQDSRRLTLIDLMGANVRNAEFAFLSACNTATGDVEGTPDEGLHLAAAMQYCGFRSVVGTLWPMADDDGPDVAHDFYGYLLNEGKGDYRYSASALRHAVQKMRERDVPIDQWINFVHYGA
jgi:CHAT domain-containing protein